MYIGITERGDAGIDLSWVQKLNKVDGVIVITKKLTDACINAILENTSKVILHLTCTGFGGSVLEPNVPSYQWQLNQLKKLIDNGFSSSQVVLRIDPLIPTKKGLKTAQTVLDYFQSLNLGVYRVRISIIDMYPHVRERFKEKDLPCPYGDFFSPNAKQINLVNNWIESNLNKSFTFECCAETQLLNCEYIGCVSKKDILIFGLTMENSIITQCQRVGCMCLNCKTELLGSKKPCMNNCLYCYWKN